MDNTWEVKKEKKTHFHRKMFIFQAVATHVQKKKCLGPPTSAGFYDSLFLPKYKSRTRQRVDTAAATFPF